MSATADPLSPANNMLERMLTWASPPRTWPMRAWLSRTRFTVICPAFIISPARMKNGIAISGKLSIPLYIRPMRRVKKFACPSMRRLREGAMRSANMTGRPHTMSSRKIQKKASDMPDPYGVSAAGASAAASIPAGRSRAGTEAGSTMPLIARRTCSTLTAASSQKPAGTTR